jgi:hypothetical protein
MTIKVAKIFVCFNHPKLKEWKKFDLLCAIFELCLRSILFLMSMESLNLFSWLGFISLLILLLGMSSFSSSTTLLPDFDLPTMMPLAPSHHYYFDYCFGNIL